MERWGLLIKLEEFYFVPEKIENISASNGSKHIWKWVLLSKLKEEKAELLQAVSFLDYLYWFNQPFAFKILKWNT